MVLDAGCLIAFERNDGRVRELIELAMATGAELHVPAGVVAQVWRDGARQARLARLVGSGLLKVHPLDLGEAQTVGAICGLAKTSDIVDASVVILARRYRAKVITSDVGDLRRLDPTLELVAC